MFLLLLANNFQFKIKAYNICNVQMVKDDYCNANNNGKDDNRSSHHTDNACKGDHQIKINFKSEIYTSV